MKCVFWVFVVKKEKKKDFALNNNFLRIDFSVAVVRKAFFHSFGNVLLTIDFHSKKPERC